MLFTLYILVMREMLAMFYIIIDYLYKLMDLRVLLVEECTRQANKILMIYVVH